MGVEKPKPSLEEIANLVETNIKDCIIGPFGFHHPDYNFVIELDECSQKIGFEYIKLFRHLESSEDGYEPTYHVQVSHLLEPWRRGTVTDYESEDEEWNSEDGRRIERMVEHLISEWVYERVLEVMVPEEEELMATVKKKLYRTP